MQRPWHIRAFTLAELLTVLVVISLILVLGNVFTSSVRNTFIAQQAVKQYIQQGRILRRKSMLVTRNSQDLGWVHAIGYQFRYNSTFDQWEMFQIKVLETGASSKFYREFPDNLTSANLAIVDLDNTQRFVLPVGFSLQFKELPNNNIPTTNTCHVFTVFYESINGKMHAYCSNGALNQPFYLYTLGAGATTKEDNPSVEITIKYPNANGEYKAKLRFSANGEIQTTQQ